MKFIGRVFATVVGIFMFLLLFFLGIIFIGTIFENDSENITTKENSVIELNLEDIAEDYTGKYDNPWLENFSKLPKVGLSDVIDAIVLAKDDDNIKGISILNDESNLGIAQTKELRDVLEDFKKSGKFVLAYANNYSQKEYYLNSVANTVYLNPTGETDFKGLSSETLFFKDFQDKSGIKLEIIRHGKYKSAVEPFLENKMSDANKEQTQALLNSIWNSIVLDISKSRNITVEKLNEIANNLLARTPEMAKTQKLIDVIAYEDEYHDAIKNILKLKKDEDYNFINIVDYTKNAIEFLKSDNPTSDQIAVIYAQGEIKNGEGDYNEIGEGSMRRALQEVRKNKNVKAIVLRIDSPGGSALTSDLIWREIDLTKKIKPVVVSMGNYAASGGYYIACNAHKIFAENTTITGSIGVFGMLPNFSTATNKLGIHSDGVKTHNNSKNYSPFSPIDENFKNITLDDIERTYNTFIKHVAQGRNMTLEQVDGIAQGRVWTGEQALKIGLVDKIGNLYDAIDEAAKIAKITKYKIENYPEYEKDFDSLFQNLPFIKSKEKLISEEIGQENYELLQQINILKKQKGVQVLLPFKYKID